MSNRRYPKRPFRLRNVRPPPKPRPVAPVHETLPCPHCKTDYQVGSLDVHRQNECKVFRSQGRNTLC